jgi:hypothetical protein
MSPEVPSLGDPATTRVALLLLARFSTFPGRGRSAATDQSPAHNPDYQQGHRHGYEDTHRRSQRRTAVHRTMRLESKNAQPRLAAREELQHLRWRVLGIALKSSVIFVS